MRLFFKIYLSVDKREFSYSVFRTVLNFIRNFINVKLTSQKRNILVFRINFRNIIHRGIIRGLLWIINWHSLFRAFLLKWMPLFQSIAEDTDGWTDSAKSGMVRRARDGRWRKRRWLPGGRWRTLRRCPSPSCRFLLPRSFTYILTEHSTLFLLLSLLL